MKLKGYAGKILIVDLTNLSHRVVDTSLYKEWGGGHGFGTKLFWDLCEDIEGVKDGRDSRNVITVAASPFSGTNVPSAGGRCEVTAVSVGHYPRNMFTRSNFGGHFSSMMKHAGWDAIAITGKAPFPVWLDIRNENVVIRDAVTIWGMDTYETQKTIHAEFKSDSVVEGWSPALEGKGVGHTTQNPSVLSIGPAGESQSALGCLVHGAGNAAGQGGFGAVFGSKNLKAISVIGTGGVEVADPAALLRARLLTRESAAYDSDETEGYTFAGLGNAPSPVSFVKLKPEHRVSACHGCVNGCKQRNAIGYGNESSCQTTAWYIYPAKEALPDGEEFVLAGGTPDEMLESVLYAAELSQRFGINSYPIAQVCIWMHVLYLKGLLGPGGKIRSNLPYEKFGTKEFALAFCEAIASCRDVGDIFKDGVIPGLFKIGREEDWYSGLLAFPYWGMPEHGYDPRFELEWGYSTLTQERDMNDHGLNWIYWQTSLAKMMGKKFPIPAETLVERFVSKMRPYVKPDELSALDYSQKNAYSEVIARQVQWINHYGRFWKNSALLCDFRWPDCLNTHREDLIGATGDPDIGEQVWWKAVTGESISYEDGIARGRRIFNLDNAIWALQGRHRSDAVFADYIYNSPGKKNKFPVFMWPATDDAGEWDYRDMIGHSLTREGVEKWKDHYYRAEGWDVSTGWPTRATLEEIGLGFVADRLERAGKIGGGAA